jgi:hypothetical protein
MSNVVTKTHNTYYTKNGSIVRIQRSMDSSFMDEPVLSVYVVKGGHGVDSFAGARRRESYFATPTGKYAIGDVSHIWPDSDASKKQVAKLKGLDIVDKVYTAKCLTKSSKKKV